MRRLPNRRTAVLTAFGTLVLQACAGDRAVGPPRIAVVEVTPAADTLVTLGQTRQLSAEAKDARSNPVSGVTFSWTSSHASVATVSETGLVTAVGNGDAQITATASGVRGKAILTVDQQIAGLAFVAEPGDAVAGEAIRPPIMVELRDAGGHRVADAEVPVTLALGVNPGGATLAGARTVTSTGGVATFIDVWLDKVAGGYRLTASARDLDPVTSAAFGVAPGPVQLAFLTQPAVAEGQVPFDPIVRVRAREDRFGNVVPDARVTVSLVVSPSGESLSGTTVVTAVDGVAAFDDLRLALPGDGFVLAATSGAATPVRGAGFRVTLTFVQVSAGDSHTCGVTVAGFAYCWGSNYSGQLGGGPIATNGLTPTPVARALKFLQVSAGGSHTCGVTSGGTAYCWGQNFQGELGDGTRAARPTPTAVAGGLRFVQVSAGSGYTCGVTTAHAAYCWGSNGLGQLGDGATDQRLTPTVVTGGLSFVQVSTGEFTHTCGVTTSHASYCWGNNTTGQLGHGAGNHEFAPSLVAGELDFVQASAGSEHSCGVTAADAAYCWGANGDGQLGDGTNSVRVTPYPVAGGVSFVSVDAGAYRHACGLTADNAAYCWGFNAFGQLGIGIPFGGGLAPAPVTGGLTFAQISVGRYHTCAVTTGNEAYCWGLNSNGQLGDRTADQRLAPTRVVQ